MTHLYPFFYWKETGMWAEREPRYDSETRIGRHTMARFYTVQGTRVQVPEMPGLNQH